MNQNHLKNKISRLPDQPGVYLFYDIAGNLIYAGKATSLKSRVRSYFIGQRNPRPIELMIHEVADVKWTVADSALEAAILESNFIKKFRPKYNIFWKDDKSWNYFLISKDEYPRFLTVREHEIKQMTQKEKRRFRRIFGPYPGLNTKAAIKILRRLFTISFCKPGAKRACLYREMNQCFGVCTGEISASDYRRKVIRPLILFLDGKKKRLLSEIEKQMKRVSADEDYEEAARLRDHLRALRRIRDIALLNKSFLRDQIGASKGLRIEGYDISNLGKNNMVGSMVVFDEQGSVKSEYRKFNIKTVANQSDVGCLAEILERRTKHDDWPSADVWLIDGGVPQVNRAIKIASGRVPVIIGIAKGPKRRKNEFIIGTKNARTINWLEKNKNLLIQVRDEAHRFAVKFQRQKRSVF